MIRIDRATRDHTELLDPATWLSSQWGGDTLRDCRGCTDCAPDHPTEKIWQCYGEGQVEDTRYGVSVCADEEDLIEYLAHTGADFDDTVIVDLAGGHSDDEGHDAHIGEDLILPTQVLSIRPVTDAFIEAVYARADQIHGV